MQLYNIYLACYLKFWFIWTFCTRAFIKPFLAYCTLQGISKWIYLHFYSIFPIPILCRGRILWQFYRFGMVTYNQLWYFCCVIKYLPIVNIHIDKSKIKGYINYRIFYGHIYDHLLLSRKQTKNLILFTSFGPLLQPYLIKPLSVALT